MRRRRLFQLLGATSALAFTNTATSQRTSVRTEGDTVQTGDGDEDCSLPECIHPTIGYSGLSPEGAGDLPEDLQPAHEVELVTGPRETANDGDETGEGGEQPVPEFHFEPTGLAVESGDIVQFTLASPEHTVTAYHPGLGRQRRVPEDVPPFSSPVLAVETFWLYRFDEPGVYDLLCAPHEIFGMVMRIVVEDPTADFGDAAYPDRRGPELTAALVLDDDALAPDRIQQQGEVSWADVADGSKRPLVNFEEPPDVEEDEEEEAPPDDEPADPTYVDEVGEQVTLTYGETAFLSNGIRVTAHEFEFDTSLGQFTQAADGMQFALLRLTGENTGDSAERLPRPWSDFAVLHTDSQTDAESGVGMDDYESFEGGEVQPGVTREGYVAFEVPEGLDQSDLGTIWFDDFLDRSINVRWTDG